MCPCHDPAHWEQSSQDTALFSLFPATCVEFLLAASTLGCWFQGSGPFLQLLCPTSLRGPCSCTACAHTTAKSSMKTGSFCLWGTLYQEQTRTNSNFMFQDSFCLECNGLTFHLDLYYFQAATFCQYLHRLLVSPHTAKCLPKQPAVRAKEMCQRMICDIAQDCDKNWAHILKIQAVLFHCI